LLDELQTVALAAAPVNLTQVNWIVTLIYFAFVLGIGFVRRGECGHRFFLGRTRHSNLDVWVGLISPNLAAQEVIPWRDIATSYFYWVGAIPATVFVGLFMMPLVCSPGTL
jgi:solute:Na+ symporter, SSS family